MGPVASFHLVRERRGRQPLVLLRLFGDRRRLAGVDGLESWHLLGTGREERTAPGVDLRRSAMFAVWRDQAALEAFRAEHPIAIRWRTVDAWHVVLRPVSARGTWRGRSIPVSDASPVDVGGPGDPGAGRPVVVLTRATVRARHWWAFARMSVHVDRALRTEPGLRAIVGIGEAPVGRIGTISVWDSSAAARSFASGAGHATASHAERADHWFAEELFAWFEPIASDGTWDGHDPVAVPVSPFRPTHT